MYFSMTSLINGVMIDIGRKVQNVKKSIFGSEFKSAAELEELEIQCWFLNEFVDWPHNTTSIFWPNI